MWNPGRNEVPDEFYEALYGPDSEYQSGSDDSGDEIPVASERALSSPAAPEYSPLTSPSRRERSRSPLSPARPASPDEVVILAMFDEDGQPMDWDDNARLSSAGNDTYLAVSNNFL